ncbi:MAG: acyltransferase [Bacteroidales bacterium]|nr:acyltransferase [Bacteroidales bacterium]
MKNFVLWSLMPKGQATPRLWVRLFINPFFHKRGQKSLVRKSSRLDVMPFNRFDIGRETTIEDFAVVNNGVGDVFVGDRTRIGIGSVLIGPVVVGNDVRLAQHVVASGLNHGYSDVNIPIWKQPVSTAPIVIGDESWIGSNAVIVSGVTIGKHCVIAAGSVVTKNIPPFSIAAGNPAKVIKKYNEITGTWERE